MLEYQNKSNQLANTENEKYSSQKDDRERAL